MDFESIIPDSQDDRYPVVYLWRNLSNDKLYVGSAKDCFKRYRDYRNFGRSKVLKPQRAIEWAMRRDGWESFEFAIIEKVGGETDLLQREQYWIDTLDTCNPKVGYNMCPIAGSTLGRIHTEETKKKIAAKRKGTKQSKQHIEASKEGVRRYWESVYEEYVDPVLQIDMTTYKVVAEHQSRFLAAKVLGAKNADSIKAVCDGKYRSSLGFFWIYKKDYNPDTYTPKVRQKMGGCSAKHIRPICQYTHDGKLVRMWPSVAEAARALGVYGNLITLCVRGRAKTAYKCKWAYLTDPVLIDKIRKEEAIRFWAGKVEERIAA